MDTSDDEGTLAVISAIYILNQNRKRKRKPRSVWVRQWIQRRGTAGAYNSLLKELRAEDPSSYKNFLRMNDDNFCCLLNKVAPFIQRRSTHMRDSLPAGEKLAITLRYLASGDSYKSLEYLYRVPKNTISKFVPEVCQAVYDVLREEYLKVPNTEDDWKVIESAVMEKWNFPHCIGAIDGKHISIRAPAKSGSEFFNYKKFFSIILLALVDADCKFIFVDVGANGRAGDAAVFANSTLSQALEKNTINIPQPTAIESRKEPVPRIVVGDEAFPLKTFLMKPYPSRDLSCDKRIFNYRLSRARRVSENAFGILNSRFQIFQRPLQISPENATIVVLACVSLHNFLKCTGDVVYNIQAEMTHAPCDVMQELNQQGGNHSGNNARAVREELTDYFINDGAVDWQWDMVEKHNLYICDLKPLSLSLTHLNIVLSSTLDNLQF